jgi:hypothetical protein
MTHNKALFVSDLSAGSIIVYIILGEPIRSQGHGTILIHAKTEGPHNKLLIISNVHYYPDSDNNLLSISILDRKGFVTRIKAGILNLIEPESDDDLIFTAIRIIDNVYLLDLASDKATVSEPQIV